MNLSEIITGIYERLLQLVPFFRVVWAATAVFSAALLVIAFLLKRNPARKQSPWIVGGIGLLAMISSGTQFIASLF